MSIDSELFVAKPESFGGDYHAQCAQLYKTYVEMADRISQRRQAANSFFLSVNTAIIGAISYLVARPADYLWLLSLSGIVLCATWTFTIGSYRRLNSAKFEVIQAIEKRLALAPYTAEWAALSTRERGRRHLTLTAVEWGVPVVFAGVHAFILAFLLITGGGAR